MAASDTTVGSTTYNIIFFRSGGLPYKNPSLTVLEMAIESNEIALVEFFLTKDADPTNPRKYSVRNGNNGINGIFVTTAVYNAIMHERLDVLILFVQNNVDLNQICFEVISQKYSVIDKKKQQSYNLNLQRIRLLSAVLCCQFRDAWHS